MSGSRAIADLLSNLKALIVLVGLFFLTFASGYLLSDCSSRKRYSLLLGEKNSTIEELSITKNEVKGLQKVLADKDLETAELKEIIRSYEDKPEQIRYIVETETVFVGNSETTTELPPSHLFRFANGLAVAQFKQEEGEYSFNTFDVTFSTDVVISEDDTAVLLTAKSSYDNFSRRIPVTETRVTKVRDFKIIEPQVQLGITGSINTDVVPSGDLSASVSIPFLHAEDDMDLLVPRVTANSSSIRIGADVISYNLGNRLPILTNVWIGAGMSYRVGEKNPSVDFTIGSKF